MPFKNCTEAYEAGYSNIPKGSPHYAAKLDRDKDGVACDNPPAGFKPRTEATAPPKKTTASVETGKGTGSQLPKTGAGEVIGVGALLVLLGVVLVLVMRRRNRKVRFTA